MRTGDGVETIEVMKNTMKKSKDIKYKPCNDYFKTCLLAKASQLDWQQTREGTEAIWGSNLQEPRLGASSSYICGEVLDQHQQTCRKPFALGSHFSTLFNVSVFFLRSTTVPTTRRLTRRETL